MKKERTKMKNEIQRSNQVNSDILVEEHQERRDRKTSLLSHGVGLVSTLFLVSPLLSLLSPSLYFPPCLSVQNIKGTTVKRRGKDENRERSM